MKKVDYAKRRQALLASGLPHEQALARKTKALPDKDERLVHPPLRLSKAKSIYLFKKVTSLPGRCRKSWVRPRVHTEVPHTDDTNESLASLVECLNQL